MKTLEDYKAALETAGPRLREKLLAPGGRGRLHRVGTG